MTRENLDNVFLKMVEMYEGQPERIQHFTKVHSYAAYIGRQEKLDEIWCFETCWNHRGLQCTHYLQLLAAHPDTCWQAAIEHGKKIGLGTDEYTLITVK